MGKIKLLSKDTIDKIAAGEVVTSPASALKEMIENSLDAFATSIIIDTKGGGKRYLAITDDGTGIEEEDIPLAFTRNATSKIDEDIEAIHTLGFRGEALASIAFVSRVKLTTRTADAAVGMECEIVEGNVVSKKKVPCRVGTKIEISDLFYNTPARLKYLKKDFKETADIIDLVSAMALSHPDVSFRLICDGKEIFFTDGSGDILKCAKIIYGRESTSGLIPVEYEDVPLYVYGYVSSASFIDGKGKIRHIFINGRLVRSTEIANTVDSLYQELYSRSRPDFILYVELPPKMLDVNIHPAKTEVKLLNSTLICMLIKDGIRKALSKNFVVNNPAPAVREKLYDVPKYEKAVFEKIRPYIFGEDKKEDIKEQNDDIVSVNDDIIPVNDDIMSPADATESDTATQTPAKEPEKQEVQSGEEPQLPEEQLIIAPEVISHEFFDKMSNMKYVGNAFSQYAMFEDGQFLYALDVHAAHERVLYERFLQAFNSRKIQVQPLLIAKIIPLPPAAHILAVENIDTLSSLGFEIEDFGGNEIALRSVPSEFAGEKIEDVISRILDEMSVEGTKDLLARNERLIKAACHNAVRGESDISEREVRNLLKDLSKTEHPYTCPHGRSVVGKLSIKYFMKAFNRI